MCGLFISAGTSAQFSLLRHHISAMERGCYLSQTKQSGELFCRSDTMRQRQLPTTYSKSQVRAARTSQSPFCHSVTFPLSGESLFEAPKKDRTMCGLFISAGTSAQFSLLRHHISAMERGCYLSQTKQSGELFCRSDTMRQRQLPTTYSKSQVRAARTSQSPFCHSVTFPLPGESLFEAPTKKIAHRAVFLFLSAPLHSSLTCDIVLQQPHAAVNWLTVPRCRWQKKGCGEQEEIQSATSVPRTVARQYFRPVTGSRTS